MRITGANVTSIPSTRKKAVVKRDALSGRVAFYVLDHIGPWLAWAMPVPDSNSSVPNSDSARLTAAWADCESLSCGGLPLERTGMEIARSDLEGDLKC